MILSLLLLLYIEQQCSISPGLMHLFWLVSIYIYDTFIITIVVYRAAMQHQSWAHALVLVSFYIYMILSLLLLLYIEQQCSISPGLMHLFWLVSIYI